MTEEGAIDGNGLVSFEPVLAFLKLIPQDTVAAGSSQPLHGGGDDELIPLIMTEQEHRA